MTTRTVSTPLEEVLRSRYEDLGHNIQADELKAHRYKIATKLRTGDQKQAHKRMHERIQIEWYKRDEIRLIAHRAGIEL